MAILFFTIKRVGKVCMFQILNIITVFSLVISFLPLMEEQMMTLFVIVNGTRNVTGNYVISQKLIL